MAEARDNLRSKSFFRIVDLTCEGEIEGLVDGQQSIYLNGTPLQNEDGSFNFKNVVVDNRDGTNDQSMMPGFGGVESEVNVSTEVKAAVPVTRTVSGADINAVRVTVSVPALYNQNTSNGDITGTSVQYQIQVQSNGGGYVPQILTTSLSTDGINTVTANRQYSTATESYGYELDLAVTKVSEFPLVPPLGSGGNVSVQIKPSASSTWEEIGVFSTSFNYFGARWETSVVSSPAASFVKKSSFGSGFGGLLRSGGITVRTQNLPRGNYDIRLVLSNATFNIAAVRVARVGGDPTATISGKTNSKYQRAHRVELVGSGPFDVRVVRITADSAVATLQNKTFWDSYTTIIDNKFRYPNSAIVGLKIDAEQFSSVPARSYDIKMLRVQIPSNYDPITRVYTGIWDGTFTTAWTDNPAWCFYNLLTNTRYGLGNFVDASQVDKWALYQVARYCDELVPDGFGGMEPRFTCNIYLQTRAEAYKVMQDMASVFRGMSYWASGAVTVSQDAPQDAAYLYTPANVIDGIFSYSGSSAKARHTVALVTWNDPADQYKQKVEYVEDAAGIVRYGVVQTEVVAVGCTSQGQANRVGRWLLYTEQSESEVVTFKCGLEGAIAAPGQVIKVADPTRAGSRKGGRIVSATASAVTLDAVTTATGTNQTLSVILPDGSVEERAIASIVGSVVTVSPAFSATPAVGAVWMVTSDNLEAQLFRVVSVVEAEDGFDISALAYNPSKYDAIEQGLELQPRDVTDLTLTPGAPENLTVVESLYEAQAEIRTLVSLSWDSVNGATSYRVSYAVGDDNFIDLPETSANSVDIRDAQAGLYTFSVTAVNSIGRTGPASIKTEQIFGKTLPPADVTEFSLMPVAGTAYLSWDQATDLDVLVGGTVRIRHSPATAGATWNNAVDILPAMSGNQTRAQAPLLTGTYLAKFIDSSGFASQNEATIVTTVPEVMALNVVETITESPSFAGTRESVTYIADVGGLALDSVNTFDSNPGLIDTWEFIDNLGGISPAGTYTFANMCDLGAVYPARITAAISAVGYDTGAIIDYRTDLLDSWTDFDGAAADQANVELYVRTTNDNPAGTPVWSVWKPFFVGEYTARAFQFQLRFTSLSVTDNISVTSLAVTVDMADRVEALDNLTSGAATYTVTYAQPFWQTPSVGITADNMTSGDYYQISNKTAAGFDIIFRNAAGAAVSKTFDVLAKGYGRQI